MLRTADYTGRIALWNTILGAFVIKYMPRTSIKGQVLADLVAEFAEPPIEMPTEQHGREGKLIGMASTPKPPCWRVYIDGAANQRGFGVGLVLITPEGATIEKSLKLGFSVTNNEAEYEALMQGMAMVQKMGGKAVKMFLDSRLVVGQVTGEMEAKDVRMQEYLNQVKRLRSGFDLFSLSHISRSGNTHADSLATLATSSVGQLPRIVLVEHLGGASKVVKNMTRVHETRVGPS